MYGYDPYDDFDQDWDDRRDDRPATESEAHVEWHLNSGVPIGQPCPWDACDPGMSDPDEVYVGLGEIDGYEEMGITHATSATREQYEAMYDPSLEVPDAPTIQYVPVLPLPDTAPDDHPF